jgi:hypothetical protein
MGTFLLIKTAKDLKSITEFVFGAGIKGALSEIVGDVHVDAARNVLSDIEDAASKRDRINSVITHLEAAHAAYAKSLRDYTKVGSNKSITLAVALFSDMSASFNDKAIDDIYDKDCFVCCMMAVCLASIGENVAAIKCLSMPDKRGVSGGGPNYDGLEIPEFVGNIFDNEGLSR